MNVAVFKKTLVQLQVKETLVILVASVFIPFIVHMIPSYGNIPLGAKILAMFYAPFIAVLFCRPHVAIITGLLSPTLNALLTHHPAQEIIAILTLELVTFSIIASVVHKRWKNFWGVAPTAYIISVSIVAIMHAIISYFILPLPVYFFLNSLLQAIPGIVILLLLNITLIRFQPK